MGSSCGLKWEGDEMAGRSGQNKSRGQGPGSLQEWLLRVVVPPDDRRHILHELDELHDLKALKLGGPAARRWRRRKLWGFVIRALPVFWWKRPLSGFLGILSNRDGRLGALDLLRQDLQFAFRSFLRKPAFTTAAILILGLGIGATTTIYSVVDTVMLRPLPYPDPGRLVHFGGYGGVRPSLFLRWKEGLNSYDGIGAAWTVHLALTEEGPPQRLRVARVTPDLLPNLGATAELGRLFMADDFEGDAAVCLLSPGIWQRNWGGDPSVLGRTIRVDGRPLVVAGVLSPGFVPPEAVTGRGVDLWVPFRAAAEESITWSILSVAGRLKEGVSRIAAQEELNTFTANLAEEYPDLLVRQDGSIRYTRLLPLQVATFREIGGPLLLLMWAVVLMLLIACANVANLLLAQATSRARELALRGALGASRSRIVRQLLTESVALALVSGILGVALAYLGVQAFLRFNPGGVPRIQALAVDPRVLLFALMASVATGLIFGTMPALFASRRDVARALQEGGVASSASRRGRRTRSALVVAEIALALVLLSSAGLFFRSLLVMTRVDTGFQVEELVTVPLTLAGAYEAPQRRELTDALIDRLTELPGTQGVAVGLTVPFEYVGASKCCIAHDISSVGGDGNPDPLPSTIVHPVTSGYFRTLGAQLSAGREFETADAEGDGRVAVINEPTARYFFGTGDPIGRTLAVGGWGTFTVVGVARGVRHWGVPEGVRAEVYVPWGRWGAFSDIYKLMVRSTADLDVLAPAIREAIWSLDPSLPVEEVVPMRQRVEASMAGRRFLSVLLGTFAALALALATGGIYASMLYTVGQRKQELGIRLALGAGGPQVVGLVLRGGLTLTLVGVALGLGGSIGISAVLRGWLYGVDLVDRPTFAGTVLLLASAALLASLVPALKAARTNPQQTLKAE